MTVTPVTYIRPDILIFTGVIHKEGNAQVFPGLRAQQVGRHKYCNVSCLDLFLKRLVSLTQSLHFLFKDNIFIHGALSDLKLFRMFSFT